MMKKLILLPVIFACVAMAARAQDEEEPKRGFDKEKLFFGGNFGLSFGSYTLVNVSPQAGYRFSKHVAAGAGINFIYTSSKYFNYRENYGVAGLNIFGRFYPIEQAFVQVQPEMNYTWGKQKFDGGTEYKLDGKMVPSFLAGGGVAIPVGSRNGAMLVMVQYDLLQQDRSPYGSKAFVSIGFNF